MKTSLISEFAFFIKDIKSSKTSRWLMCAILVGLAAGIGAIVLYALLDITSTILLNHIAGFPITHPTNEPPLIKEVSQPFNRIYFIVIAASGGLLSGLIANFLSKETAGGGTGTVIGQYHNKKSIALRVPFVKLVVSVLSLGTGAAGGREGPAAQIGAGFGYQIGKLFKLSDKEKRILMVCGMAAGIGAIFRSPMGAAIYAVEVLYQDLEFEYEALLPASISSIVAYSLFSAKFGWVHMFSIPHMVFSNPVELIPYTLLGILCAAAGIIFINIFNTTSDIFKKISYPLYIKTAIGGLVIGLFGAILPNSAGMGYGILQNAFLSTTSFYLMFAIGIVRMFTTSITLGSGNSAGLFAPMLIIGAALGSGFGGYIYHLAPVLVSNPGAFAVVGMAGFFAAAAKTPLSVIILVAEITGNYELIVPSMWVVSISVILSSRFSIERSQAKNRALSPVHEYEYMHDVLESIKVKDLMIKDFVTVEQSRSLKDIYAILSESKQTDLLVVDEDNRLSGIITLQVLKTILGENEMSNFLVARDVANTNLITTHSEENLNTLMHKIGFKEINTVPIVDDRDSRKIIGVIRRKDVIKAYDRARGEIENIKRSQ